MACFDIKIGCDNSVDLGCFDYCGDITITSLLAVQDGEHTINYRQRGHSFSFKVNATIGNPFVFPNHFNANSEVCFQIIQPDGANFQDADLKETFYFNVVQRYSVDEVTICN